MLGMCQGWQKLILGHSLIPWGPRELWIWRGAAELRIFNLTYTGTSLPSPKQLCANLSKATVWKNVSPNPCGKKMLSGQPGGPRMYPRSGYFLVTSNLHHNVIANIGFSYFQGHKNLLLLKEFLSKHIIVQFFNTVKPQKWLVLGPVKKLLFAKTVIFKLLLD